ncbi:MAG: hypothetical protein WC284_08775 [Candidimonas sp.]
MHNHIYVDPTAWSDGQIKSKLWLTSELEKIITKPVSICLLGGWYGLLAFLILSRSNIPVKKITNYDIDDEAVKTSIVVNNMWSCNGSYHAITMDANLVNLDQYDVVINTSCEHFTDHSWFDKITNQIVAVQSTNFSHDDHYDVIPHESIEDLADTFDLKPSYSGKLTLSYPDKSFDRYMIIGQKNQNK